jgi:hypothetical protein
VRSDSTDEHIEYLAWLTHVERDPVTPPLAEYLRWCAHDGNLPWRLDTGHLVNLLDQATDALEAAYGSATAMREALVATLGPQEDS